MKISKIRNVILLISITLFLSSCLNNVEENSNIEEEVEVDACLEITFATNVKPIIDANCIQCHGTGGNSPNLTSYNSISANSGSVKAEVVSRRMPQGFSLSQEDIDAIVCWVDSGAINN